MAANNTFGTPDNTIGTLNGLFKQAYADKLQDLIPDGVKLLNEIKFNKKDMLGDSFNQPVVLGMEHGITFATSTDDAFALNVPVAGRIQNAVVRGSPAVLRSVIGYKAASASASSGAAFEQGTKFLVGNMLRSFTKAMEIELLYGGMGYGTVSAYSTGLITIATAEWAPGIWMGAEGMPIDVYDASGTLRGTSAIASVDITARTLTISPAVAGTVATDVVYRANAFGKEFIGIHKILTTSGTLFGINNTNFNMFKGNTYSAGSAALSFTKLNLAAARAVEKGLDGKLVAMVNPRAWANMLTDQAALRQYDTSYSESGLKQGSKKLTFFSQNGEIEIMPSIYVKEGYAYLLDIDTWMRVGSQEISYKRPGVDEGNFFRDLESAAGYELRLYTDQAVFTSKPCTNVVITGIVNDQ